MWVWGYAAMINAIAKGYSALHFKVRQFQRDEDGAMIIFGLMFLILMVMIGGLAVDTMKYEYTRTRLTYTLDRATLAAASLTNAKDPTSVVTDYMQKAGLADQLRSVQVTSSMNERIVHSTGLADSHPVFMQMMGINRLDASAASEAQQAISNLEIVLVLDVSGSMSGQKIANLKIAADEFVDTMMANDPYHRVSVAIVPYNAQVNIGPLLAAKFNLTHRANVTDVNCVEVPPGEYAAQALSLTDPMPMMAYADISHATNIGNAYTATNDTNYAVPNYNNAFCKPTTVNVVRLPSNNPTTLKAQIDALQAGGNTSITLGMKWGVTLLDPSMRPTFNQFIATGNIPSSLPARPFDYNDKEALKIVVLMTDGDHVAHNRINDAYKTGPSPIWKAPDGKYSIQFTSGRPVWAGTNTWYVPHLSQWQAAAYNGGGTAVQQDWKDIWASLKMNYVAWQFYGRALGSNATTGSTTAYNNKVNALQSIYASVPAMDASLQTSCDQARANGVVIYGIAVEAPAHGNEVITNCAMPERTFITTGGALPGVFRTIAANLTQLKLTQ